MRPHQRSSRQHRGCALVAVIGALALSTVVQGASGEPGKKAETCGILEGFSGRLQLISPDRTSVREPSKKLELACDSWISTTSGSASVHHREGYRFQIGKDSFFQLKKEGEHGVLYRGVVHAEGLAGAGEMKVLTANGRVRTKRGPVVVIFDPREEKTQAIALGYSASLENRFASSRPVSLRAGEMSSMDFGRLRVVPSAAVPIAHSGLRQVLSSLQLGTSETQVALQALERGQKGARAPASVKPSVKAKSQKSPKKMESSSYERHRAGEQLQDERLRDHMVRRLSAGSAVAEDLLFPAQSHGRSPSSLIEVEPVGSGAGLSKAQKEEKQRLIDELTRIRGE